jgi:hypothetical protein
MSVECCARCLSAITDEYGKLIKVVTKVDGKFFCESCINDIAIGLLKKEKSTSDETMNDTKYSDTKYAHLFWIKYSDESHRQSGYYASEYRDIEEVIQHMTIDKHDIEIIEYIEFVYVEKE